MRFSSMTIGSLAAILFAVGCMNSPKKVEEPVPPRISHTEENQGIAITNSAANEVAANEFVEIKFKPGSATLTETSRRSLASLIADANKTGKISEVLVMSWSDDEYPASKQELPKRQRNLAENRNQAVRSYLKSVQDIKIDTYNMAERPGTVAKWFDTTDNRLKKSFVAAGLPTTADDPQYPSKASHSVVFVKTE